MPDWLFSRSTVIALALAGGALSILASWCHSRNRVSEKQLHLLNRAAYVFMGASMILFVFAGLVGAGSDSVS